ncbi:hypothetical protein HYH03_013198 [Edaphochlamys debaryana]|uniref:C2 NT-type domain-containing protein n=1 Tax=Edaphochlamys debaryana TaxID=47281 RepID=A0A835XR49_9CHLO|nr:hypothetical protein HYH03_013198 [Edaphochlamys debaryana]|eukprot:KAG2488204.1 hypothetical protein HYH03_013198 [Edaphochlamys debaryana]
MSKSLEATSVSTDVQRRTRGGLFGGGAKKIVSFHVVISELRAELMSVKGLAQGQPCILQWVRGETVHVTEDSVGQTVLSWSDTYFTQVISLALAPNGNGFRPKECKFKVQQRGKTVAKTAVIDLAKYCSEFGNAREQSVSVPLQPSGNLYFVVSTLLSTTPAAADAAPSATSLAGPGAPSAADLHAAMPRPSGGFAAASVPSAAGGASTSTAGESAYGAITKKYGRGSGRGGDEELDEPGEERSSDRTTGAAAAAADRRGHERPSGGGGWGWRKAKNNLLDTPAAQAAGAAPVEVEGTGGFFKRKVKAKSGAAAAAAAAAGSEDDAAALAGSVNGAGGRLPLRKIDSERFSRSGGPASWDFALTPGSDGGAGGGGGGAARRSSAAGFSQLMPASSLPTGISPRTTAAAASAVAAAAAASGGTEGSGGGGRHALARRSAASEGSEAVHCAVPGGSATKSTDNLVAMEASKGWGAWLKGGLGWGRGSNPSGTNTSVGTGGGASAHSMHGPGGGPPEHDSCALETAIRTATEVPEVREIALDMLHERNEWRNRALAAQDELGRVQSLRGSAVREAQRLQVRLREFEDELGRRKDGSLLQELVEAKVRIADLANENMKLRRQITHMGPLFYGDHSGDEAPAAPELAGTAGRD